MMITITQKPTVAATIKLQETGNFILKWWFTRNEKSIEQQQRASEGTRTGNVDYYCNRRWLDTSEKERKTSRKVAISGHNRESPKCYNNNKADGRRWLCKQHKVARKHQMFTRSWRSEQLNKWTASFSIISKETVKKSRFQMKILIIYSRVRNSCRVYHKSIKRSYKKWKYLPSNQFIMGLERQEFSGFFALHQRFFEFLLNCAEMHFEFLPPPTSLDPFGRIRWIKSIECKSYSNEMQIECDFFMLCKWFESNSCLTITNKQQCYYLSQIKILAYFYEWNWINEENVKKIASQKWAPLLGVAALSDNSVTNAPSTSQRPKYIIIIHHQNR